VALDRPQTVKSLDRVRIEEPTLDHQEASGETCRCTPHRRQASDQPTIFLSERHLSERPALRAHQGTIECPVAQAEQHHRGGQAVVSWENRADGAWYGPAIPERLRNPIIPGKDQRNRLGEDLDDAGRDLPKEVEEQAGIRPAAA
jgi:hypothetical protein